MSGWIGVDLDGTLAHYTGWKGANHIGEPIARMVERVKTWLSEGREVRIFTARVAGDPDREDIKEVRAEIEAWLLEHLGTSLPVTNQKDYGMIELWDDCCVQVVINTGIRADGRDGDFMGDTRGRVLRGIARTIRDE